MADRAGQTIGEYTLHEPLGTDRYGTRYRATATTAGDAATVRIIPPPTSDDRWFADRVASTLRRYIGIESPHLAAPLAVGEDDGAVYVVGPPLVGPPLRSRLGAPLPLPDVVAILGPIATALDTLHGRYLVHGDLRPETIILADNGPILADAGLAPAIADAARLSAEGAYTVTGTEATYRAPEALSGGLSDARADIYSLGVVAYEALTGRLPFRPATADDSATALAGQRGNATPTAPHELNPAIPVAASDALLRALATSTYERPGSAGELLDALGAASDAPAATVAATRTAGPAQTTPHTDPAPSNIPSQPFTSPATFTAPTWTPPTPPPAPILPPPTVAPTPAPHTASGTLPTAGAGPQRADASARDGVTQDRPLPTGSRAASTAYTYASPPTFNSVMPPTDTAQQLVAGRALLVDTLAALARQRATPPLAVGRQQLVGTLRAVTTTAAPQRANHPRATQELSRRLRQAEHHLAPAARAERYVDNWREVYSVPRQEAISALVKGSSTVVFGAVFGAMIFRDIRCVFLILIVGSLGLLASWRSATERAIICNADGFIVETGFFPWQRVGRFYRWSAVRATRYHEANPRKSKGNRAAAIGIGHFAVTTPSGEVFDQTNTYAGFDFRGLILRFGEQTPHLTYIWLPNDLVGERPVINRVGAYSMVTHAGS